ncbi:hypothetical protein [Oceaniglobus roseus]|uniref:hypothetical protein n=1 Tax=Oceaniglobus roseus TaxID=1737570 RepID=UPI001562A5AF|nr:hypothetical protein [Kandeliimicrobium roseum]
MDIARRAYRIRLSDGGPVALLPETLVAEDRPSHGAVYRWLADHAADIERAVRTLHRGKRPKPALDTITLEETS